MTISSTQNRVPYTGNGVTTNFAFPYLFLANADLKVYENGLLRTLGTHYTVSGAGNPAGGTVAFVTPPANGVSIVILNDPPVTQTTDLEDNDSLPAEALERALDRLTIIAQRLSDRLNRAAVLPDSYAGSASPALPTPEASAFLGWTSDARALRNYTRTEVATIAAFGDAIVDQFTGDGSTTAFTLSKDPGSQDNLLVTVGGVVQGNGADFTWGPSAPTTLTFASAPPNGAKIQVYYQQALPTEDSVLRADLADTNPTNGAALVGFKQAGTGAVTTTVQTKLREFVSVKDFGAVGDGVTDDTAAINAAISARNASGGGVVYFPAGTYRVKSSIQYMPGVDLIGEGMFATTLKWHPDTNTGGAILNTANQSLNRAKFCGFRFTKEPSISAAVTGILGGSTLANYNSAIACFENLHFDGLTYGIRGNAEPAGVGIFDCLFKNIWCSGCSYGLWLFGSGNRVEHPRMTLCDHGIALDYLNAESFDGHTITGGIFVQNNYDIGVLSANGIRPTKIIGTWFEQSTFGIINIPYAGTRVMNLDFSGCMLSTSSTVNMFNVFNAVGTVTVDRCTLISGGSGKAQNFVRPSSANSRLIVKDCQKYDASGVSSLVSDFGYFQTDKAGANQTIPPATITKLTWSAANKLDSAGAFDDANDQYVAPVPGVYRVRAQATFGAHSVVGNTNQLYVYKNGVVQRRALLQSSSTTPQTIGIDCYVSCATNDVVDIRFQHTNGTNIDVLGNAETTFFSVQFVSPQ